MIIELPYIPPSMNQYAGRENSWAYRNEKRRVKDHVCWIAKGHKERFEKARVSLIYHFADNRRRDPDNYCGKFILDGLTAAGVIKDDDFEHIELEVRKGENKRPAYTEIVITEIGGKE